MSRISVPGVFSSTSKCLWFDAEPHFRRLECVRQQACDGHRPYSPGHGRYAPGDGHRRIEIDISDEADFAVGHLDSVDTNVDYGSAWLDPLALNEPRTANRSDKYVRHPA